ncbi:amidohydrolase family protein [Coprobacillaceae bacterium CR2/5/TPMF4]|nr:amidohydrolase family protein [Coprobacillaceae bacterium CR2/5/TPMF4]
MIKPYLNSQGYCGYPQFSDDQLYQLIAQAIEDHQQLLAHCNGDRACQQYISQFERYLNNYQGAKTYDPVMIHAQLVTKEQLVKMKKIQMIPSFFIAHTFIGVMYILKI